MGYNTEFTGELKFTHEATVKQLAALKEILGEDCRDHPEWKPYGEASYIDLVLTDDYSGLCWNEETEKTYGLVDSVNLVTRLMRAKFPEFNLSGELLAQGEERDDRWVLAIDDKGVASKRKVVLTDMKVKCPDCGSHFRVHVETGELT